MERTALVLTSSSSTWDGLQAVQFESRVQISDHKRVYFFRTLNDAQNATAQVPPAFKYDLQRKVFWTVTELASQHVPGHYAAVLEHEKKINMTYETTEEARRLRANGADMATIINHLTRQGAKGWISKHKMQAIQRLLDEDLSSFTYQPTPGETQMSSLIRMLSEREK